MDAAEIKATKSSVGTIDPNRVGRAHRFAREGSEPTPIESPGRCWQTRGPPGRAANAHTADDGHHPPPSAALRQFPVAPLSTRRTGNRDSIDDLRGAAQGQERGSQAAEAARTSNTGLTTHGETSMKILVTGSNRGLGLELVSQYVADGWQVFACCRHPAEAEALHALADEYSGVSIHRLDITRADDLRSISWELSGEPLDLLFNNAGIYLEQDYELPRIGAIRYDGTEMPW
jgi:hypothetical protein